MSATVQALKNQLLNDIELKSEIGVEGINLEPEIFKTLALGTEYQEQVHTLFEFDHEAHEDIPLPCGFTNPNDVHFGFKWDRRSYFDIIREDGSYLLRKKGKELFPIAFNKRPKYFELKGSDGTPFKTVGNYAPGELAGSTLNVAYSNECALKETGLDCLFCNANATAARYAHKEGVTWKNPRLIGEALKAAWELDGVRHFTLTGGFIPERREVDYYLDVAEAIVDIAGLEDFNGTAVIGAPLDLEIIDKYAESAFRTLSINLEVWNPHYFEIINPGKSSQLGGRGNWIKALEYAAKKFGWGKVRTSFVTGIEPKNFTIEGVEYLASIGVISLTGGWNVGIGSALEGHRTPEPAWHWDMYNKAHDILKKYGFKHQDYFDVSPGANTLVGDLFAVEEELFPIQKELTQNELTAKDSSRKSA
ncbi:MAG: radical SAM protein [Clostridiales bacterium]|nr:radical SAM protein [Clostridiales bacterium]